MAGQCPDHIESRLLFFIEDDGRSGRFLLYLGDPQLLFFGKGHHPRFLQPPEGLHRCAGEVTDIRRRGPPTGGEQLHHLIAHRGAAPPWLYQCKGILCADGKLHHAAALIAELPLGGSLTADCSRLFQGLQYRLRLFAAALPQLLHIQEAACSKERIQHSSGILTGMSQLVRFLAVQLIR